MPRSVLALSVLLCLWLAPAAAPVPPTAGSDAGGEIHASTAEHGDTLARSATGLELLRDLGSRLPAPASRTAASGNSLLPRAPAPERAAGPVARPREIRADLRLPRGEHLPYFPTAPPLAS